MSGSDTFLPSERLAGIEGIATNSAVDLHLEPQEARQRLHHNLLHIVCCQRILAPNEHSCECSTEYQRTLRY